MAATLGDLLIRRTHLRVRDARSRRERSAAPGGDAGGRCSTGTWPRSDEPSTTTTPKWSGSSASTPDQDLFPSNRDERIDASSTASREPARQRRHEREHDDDTAERRWIERIDAEEQRRDDLPCSDRRNDADDGADGSQRESFARRPSVRFDPRSRRARRARPARACAGSRRTRSLRTDQPRRARARRQRRSR